MEIAQIQRALAVAGDEPSWLATVVDVEGSAYRHPGARMLFSRDGKLAGSISGGCLEREVMRTGGWLAQQGPLLRTFDARRDEDGDGAYRSGCNGQVKLLIEPVTDFTRAALAFVERELTAQRAVALGTVVAGGSARLGAQLIQGVASHLEALADPTLSQDLSSHLSEALKNERRRYARHRRDSFEALLEVLEPEPHVGIFGTGEDVVPVARLVAQLGWGVSVLAQHGGFAARDRFSGVAALRLGSVTQSLEHLSRHARTLAVVMNHDYEQDRETLAALLASGARYIGMLGPARRTQRMLAELEARERFSPARLACVYGPCGLHLGADTPESIALSVVAEMQAVLADAGAGFLRDRSASIHERPRSLRLARAEGA